MVILFQSKTDDPDKWRRAFADALPEAELRIGAESVEDPAEVDYAVAWKPPKGLLRQYPNLKAILSLGAGVDHLASDPELPTQVPVVRLVDPGLTWGMTEYVVWAVLGHHRRTREYRRLQAEHRWERLEVPLGPSRRVGVMGLGELGADAARALKALRFKVAGWSNRRKEIDGVESFAGREEFGQFLVRTEILVNLLPLTEETAGILNRHTLGELPKGACLVNAARGGHLVEADLLELLDTGQIAEATLDVFREEPLPAGHPFWDHPRITVTPHEAAITPAETAAATIAENIRRIERGEPPSPVVDFSKGY
jgi:glyoxylate/hydroxypyruvate reductase A